MYTETQSITPALRGHLVAQMSVIDDLSQSMLRSCEKLSGLNMLAVRALVDEAATLNPQTWPGIGANLISPSTAAAESAIDKLRDYQQHLSRITVESQIDLTRIFREHSILTSRTAGILSDDIARKGTEKVNEA